MTANPLIQSDELAERLAGHQPPVLADVRWTLNGPPGRPDFERGHLPTAQWVDLEHELSGPPGAGGRHPLPNTEVFAAAIRRIGVEPDRPVVVYDAANALAASRLWWLLTDAGHPDVRVLDGGLAAWRSAGRPLEIGPGRPVEPGSFVGRPGHRARVDGSAIADRVAAGAFLELVDVRAPDRFSGESEPIDAVAGHIPGAVNRPSMDNLGADGRFLTRAEIAGAYHGIANPVLYCGSGITAAHSLLALESAGLTGTIYPGSWSDWITDPTHPIA